MLNVLAVKIFPDRFLAGDLHMSWLKELILIPLILKIALNS